MFRVSLLGESHGRAVGVLIEGCPPGLKISEEDIDEMLALRSPGSIRFTSRRREPDKAEIMSGVFKGYTTGAPILILIRNKDVDSSPYEKIRFKPRPGHADYTAYIKYRGFNDYRGGGMFSGRLTAGLVAAGAVAKKILSLESIEVYAYLREVGGVKSTIRDVKELKKAYESPFYCPDLDAVEKFREILEDAARAGDSVGGVVEGVAVNVPVGLGEPPIDTLEGDLAKALFAIPAAKGVEFGSGFKLAEMRGSEANDEYVIKNGRVVTLTNNSGGILGGISNGMPIVVRVAFKPTPSISRRQRTVDLRTMEETWIRVEGRHDVCIAIRAVPVVDAVISIVLADHLLRWYAWTGIKY